MRYALSVNFEGAVTKADGDECRSLSLIGSGDPPESADQWQLWVEFVWPQMPNDDRFSAQIEMRAPMEAVLRGSFRSGDFSTVTDEGGTGQAWMLGLDFMVNESAGWFAGTRGSIRLDGTATIQGFQLTANLELDAPENAWFPLNGGLLSGAEEDAGASHVGPNPLPGNRERPYRRGKGEIQVAEHEQQGHNPPGVTSGSPERAAEQMAATVMTFDLAAELAGLRSERSWTTGERNGKTLVREPDFRVVLTAMRAGTRLAEHEADARLSIQTVAGHLRIQLQGRVVDLPASHLLVLDRSVPHEVEALEDSAFLLTLAWPGAGGRA